MRRMLIALVAMVLLVVTGGAGAQTFQGSLRGTVRDIQGVVPGVSVTALNEANGVSRKSVTNKAGEYSFPALDTGSYTVKAVMVGYKTLECKMVRVTMATPARLGLLLEAGDSAETVTLTSRPVIDTASTGNVIDQQMIDLIPTTDRNIFLLMKLVPGVQ